MTPEGLAQLAELLPQLKMSGSVFARVQPASELRRLWQEGRLVGSREYLQEHPELGDQQSVVLDLAYEEFCLRQEAGEAVDVDAFCAQFPRFQGAIRKMILGDHFLQEELLRRAEPRPTPAWPKVGETLLDFFLLAELGRGAIARVYLATEAALGRRLVALKVSYGGGAEAVTHGRLTHPNVVPVYSVQRESHSGLTVVCMPYLGSATLEDVRGHVVAAPSLPALGRVLLTVIQEIREPAGSLAPAIPRTPPDHVLQRGSYVEAVCHLAAQLADALDFMHQRGVYHRDLKPSNVLLTPDGRPLLLDFNLSFDQQRANCFVGGTMPYMAPEQWSLFQEPRHPGRGPIDGRSDLYSLGVILYELLTGVHPFAGQSLPQPSPDRAAPPLRRRNPEIDPALARMIERCLAFDPKHRPQTAHELAKALRRRGTRRHRARRWVARHPLSALGATMLLLLAVGGSSWLASNLRRDPEQEYRRGVAAFREGRADQALTHLDRALAADPQRGDVFFARGLLRHRQNDVQGALEDYEKAEQLSPSGPVEACIGLMKTRLLDHATAIPFYQAAIQHGFGPGAVYNDLAYSYMQSRSLGKALEHFTQALDQGAPPRTVLRNRAQVNYRLALQAWSIQKDNLRASNYVQAAIKDIEAAIALAPASADFYYTQALSYCLAGEFGPGFDEKALDALAQALDAGLERSGPRQDPLQDVTLRRLKQNPRFQQLLQRPPRPAVVAPFDPLLDPVVDFPGAP